MNLTILAKLIVYYSPKRLQRFMSDKAEQRKLELARKRMLRTVVGKDYVLSLIESLDLNCDVMLHTSMMSIGKMQIGIKGICEALCKRIDLSRHSLLVSALPYRGKFRDYLGANPVFDVRTAPIEMGAINERISKMADARRSVHPTHSVVAVGRDSDYYTTGHELDRTPFGEHSPYRKLIERGGKIVLFGADLNNMTIVHAIEDMLGDAFPLPVYYPKTYEVECIDCDGGTVTVTTPCHNMRLSIYRNLMRMYDEMKASKVMQTYPLGESELSVVDAAGFARFYLEQLRKGRSMYGRIKTDESLRRRIDDIEGTLLNAITK